MKSVGEGMAIGRTFKESLQKAIRSMEVKRFGFGLDRNDKWLAARREAASRGMSIDEWAQSDLPDEVLAADGSPIEWPIQEERLVRKLSVPSQGRLYYVRYAMKMGFSRERIYELTRIDPWFLAQFEELVSFEDTLCAYSELEAVPREVLFRAKQLGYSDPQLANLYLGTISTEDNSRRA